jgi:DNA-directed RNA polymerase subunit RPC12/RpoP
VTAPAPAPTTTFHCPQCGGELNPDEGQSFITCPYCSSTVYLDKSRVVFHWYLAPTLDVNESRAALNRWMAGNQTVKDLDQKSQVTAQEFSYFPIWYFREKDGARDVIRLEPAAATSVTELRTLSLPAGDLRKYDDSVEPQAVQPTVPLQTAESWLVEHGAALPSPSAEIAETALVHIPIYTFKYTFRNQPFTAVVEAATGRTLANIFPAKAETPYVLVGAVSAAIFLCLAAILAAGFFDTRSLPYTLLTCLCGGTLAVGAISAVATWVASKV